MIETSSKKVAPENEENVISLMSNFGWILKSSQEINTTDSHLENRNGDIYNVTTKENYVKLVFTRDTNIPNYSRLKELETKFYNMLNMEPDAPQFRTGLFVILFFIYILPGILYCIHYNKKKKQYENDYYEWDKMMATEGAACLEEANSLL